MGAATRPDQAAANTVKGTTGTVNDAVAEMLTTAAETAPAEPTTVEAAHLVTHTGATSDPAAVEAVPDAVLAIMTTAPGTATKAAEPLEATGGTTTTQDQADDQDNQHNMQQQQLLEQQENHGSHH